METEKNLVFSHKETAMEKEIIEVGMADMRVAKAPGILVTRGLGSCLGITLYDPTRKTGAMAHSMLPDITKALIRINTHRFVNSGLDSMLKELNTHGCNRLRLEAKLFGCARMFSFIAKDSVLNVGDRNLEMAKAILAAHKIPVVAEETGGSFGRTIEFTLETGKVLVRTITQGEKEV